MREERYIDDAIIRKINIYFRLLGFIKCVYLKQMEIFWRMLSCGCVNIISDLNFMYIIIYGNWDWITEHYNCA